MSHTKEVVGWVIQVGFWAALGVFAYAVATKWSLASIVTAGAVAFLLGKALNDNTWVKE